MKGRFDEERDEDCSNCKFGFASTRGAGRIECHRYPPTFSTDPEREDGWPETHPDDYCGEWVTDGRNKKGLFE